MHNATASIIEFGIPEGAEAAPKKRAQVPSGSRRYQETREEVIQEMKRIAMLVLPVVLIVVLILGASTAMAAKPDRSTGNDVIARSNGFPSGAHFNLNIHGKNDSFICDSSPGGGSVFIDEYGPATIQYVSNKKSSVTELKVLDPCAVDGGTAKVQLPHEQQGYYVFARILAKPNNGSSGTGSSIILYPNEVAEACNDPGNPDFGDLTECPDDSLLALGLIVGTNMYTAEPEQYVRFDPEATKARGKSKATNITRLFTFSGWVVDERLDVNENGVIDEGDVPADAYNTIPETRPYDADGNLIIDVEEWLTFQSEQDPPMAWYFDEEWIFNIADLVVTEQGLVNNGTKLLQIRFYPVATTEFTP